MKIIYDRDNALEVKNKNKKKEKEKCLFLKRLNASFAIKALKKLKEAKKNGSLLIDLNSV